MTAAAAIAKPAEHRKPHIVVSDANGTAKTTDLAPAPSVSPRRSRPLLVAAITLAVLIGIGGTGTLAWFAWKQFHRSSLTLDEGVEDMRPRSGTPETAQQAAHHAPATRTTHARYSRDDFRSAVVGMSPDQILKLLGKPNSTHAAGEWIYWDYERRTTDPITGKKDLISQIIIERGRAIEVTFVGS
jgi:hypothetical protein